jgi:hypothetical protein
MSAPLNPVVRDRGVEGSFQDKGETEAARSWEAAGRMGCEARKEEEENEGGPLTELIRGHPGSVPPPTQGCCKSPA